MSSTSTLSEASQVVGFDEPAPSAEVSWLQGLEVMAAGTSVSLNVACRMLEQLGARVTLGTPGHDVEVDVVLVDRISDRRAGIGPEPVAAVEYLRHVDACNTAVWVTASAYGLDTNRADDIASDLTLMAAAGILGHSGIGDEWAPTVPPGELGLKMVGYVMAVAALHAVHVRRATDEVLHVDVSAQGAVIATGLTLEMAHALSNCPDEGGSARYGAPTGFFQCPDGLIYALVLEQHQWVAFRRALAPALDSIETLVLAREHTDFVNAQLAAWAATRTAEECERTLQNAGVPCTRINTVDTLTERAHAAGRPVDLTSPLPAVVRQTAPGASKGRVAAIPLTDLRVLDAGHVLAVPLGAAWLGAMGATVTKLEDPQRLDIYRRRGPFAEGVAGLNRSAYFNQLNACKTTMDFAAGQDDLDLDAFDVVLHNLTPRRAKVVGVDSDRVLAAAADGATKLAISSSGFGSTGEWAGYRAYGHNIHAFSGLVAATRDSRGNMGDMGTPWADPLSSVAIAAWVLAWALDPERRSSFGIDISMAELTASQIADLRSTDPADSYRTPAGGASFFLRAPGDKQLLAVTVTGAEQAKQFASVVGHPVPTTTLGQLVELDLSPSDLVKLEGRLRAAGVPASVVYTAHELARDEFVRSTGLYQSVHSDDLGDHEITGLPWHFAGHPHPQFRAAPERPHN